MLTREAGVAVHAYSSFLNVDEPLDRDAFDRWARPRLLTLVRYASWHGVDPEDVVQETLIRARQQWPTIEVRAITYAWCRTVATRLVHDERRRAYRKREEPQAEPATTRPGSVTGPEEQVVADLGVRRVLADLDSRDREVLAMRMRGLDADEIARELTITREAARQALWRARKKFARGWQRGELALFPAIARWRRRVTGVEPAFERMATSSAALSAAVALTLVATMGAPTKDATAPESGPAAQTGVRDRVVANPVEPLPTRRRGGADREQVLATSRAERLVMSVSRNMQPIGADPGRDDCTLRVCVAPRVPDPRPDPERGGDHLYLKYLKSLLGEPGVSQEFVRVCELIPDNAVLGCEREEPDSWVVDPPAPQPTGVQS